MEFMSFIKYLLIIVLTIFQLNLDVSCSVVDENKESYELEVRFNLDLLRAAKQGNLNFVKEALNNGADINYTHRGGAAIHHAIVNDEVEVLSYLISKGANIYLIFSGGISPVETTPIELAISDSKYECLKVLLAAENKLQNSKVGNPLKIAFIGYKPQAIKLLLEHGYDPNATIHSISILFLSIMREYTEIFDVLIEFQPNLDFLTEVGISPMHLTVEKNNEYFLQKLLEKSANPDIRNKIGYTPLMSSVIKGHLNLTKNLIKGGARVNLIDESGYTVLHHAALLGDKSHIEYLLKMGADENIKDKNGVTAKELIDLAKGIKLL